MAVTESPLDAAIRAAREALWSCAVAAAEIADYRIERICDEARWTVNEFAETQAEA